MLSPVQPNCDAHDTIANGQYGPVWSMGHTQQVCVRIVLLPSNVWQQFFGRFAFLRQQETDLPPAELWCACSVLLIYKVSQRSHLTDSEAWRVVGRLEGGQTQAKVARVIRVSQSVISRIWNHFLETESAGQRPGQGRRRVTTPNGDRYLVLTARRHQNTNATFLQQHLRSATGTTVPTQTVRNRLHGVGLYALRPLVCVRLTSRHPRDCRERIFIWRDRGSRNNPAFVHESVRFGGGGVLVYGGISIDGRTDLYIIRDGPLTARRYRDEILRPIVVPYAAAIGDNFILIDDNSRPHRAILV
ncbi:transposable element Tcb2 transposase [Trichonephila clavipes]|nr:transposable element Tcb2 transposase [Trichonephila clavipes]